MIREALINRYLSMMMPNASEEQEQWQRDFFETKSEDELRKILNDCYDLEKRWGKGNKKKYK